MFKAIPFLKFYHRSFLAQVNRRDGVEHQKQALARTLSLRSCFVRVSVRVGFSYGVFRSSAEAVPKQLRSSEQGRRKGAVGGVPGALVLASPSLQSLRYSAKPQTERAAPGFEFMMQRPHSLPWAIAILAGLHLSLMAPSAQDWPFWRGPFRNGISPETGLSPTWPAEGPKVLWKAALGKGFSSLTISRGQVYSLGNHEGTDTLYCLDAETGRGLWKHSYPCPLDPKSFEGGPLATPVVDGDRVYSLSKFGDGF